MFDAIVAALGPSLAFELVKLGSLLVQIVDGKPGAARQAAVQSARLIMAARRRGVDVAVENAK